MATVSATETKNDKSTEATVSLSESSIDKEVQRTGTILDKKPKRQVKLIDRAALENKTTPPPHVVGINGYVFRIPWNKTVEVPAPVYEILERQGLC